MYPEILTIGPITLHTFGAMMGLGFLVGANLTGRELARRGMDEEWASNILVAAAVGGIAGSKLWAVFNEWDSFLAAPITTFFSGAGFVWYGGLIGGALAVTLIFRHYGIPWLRGADCMAPGLVLGQAIGRIGCHLAGDGDWGIVTDAPWGVAYTRAIIGWPYAEGVLVHPTPLYEAFAYTVIFVILWALRKRLTSDGMIFAVYLLMAPAARFAIEFVRINPPVFAGLTQAQLFSLALVASGGILLAFGRSRALAPPSGGQEPAAAQR